MSRQQQYQIVAAHLRKQIENGSLPPGAAIPSDAELCQQFDCARGTIRQAITALRNEGLVSSGQGRRTRVLDTVPTQYFDAVLSFTQWCHASGIEPGQQTQYVMRRLADAELAALLEIPEGTPIVSVYRLRLMDGQKVMVQRLNYPLEVGKHILAFDPDSGSIHQQLADSGVDINYATRTVDVMAVEQEDATLLGIEPGTPLLRVRRRSCTLDGTPIEASDERYIGTVANFTTTATRGNPAPSTLLPNPPTTVHSV